MICHPIVLTRKLVQNGIMIAAINRPRRATGTLTAIQYATGIPMMRHSRVPTTPTHKVLEKVVKNVGDSAST